jgi:site-specific recombinase XerD
MIPLVNTIEKILLEYTKELKKELPNNTYLFPTKNGNKLLKKNIDRILNKLRYCLTFSFTWHQLRHTFATELVRNNFDIYNISQILGHSSIDTTKIYLSVDTERMKKQLDAISLFT